MLKIINLYMLNFKITIYILRKNENHTYVFVELTNANYSMRKIAHIFLENQGDF